jgi:hypothetical protein
MKLSELMKIFKDVKKITKKLNPEVNIFFDEQEYIIEDVSIFRIVPDISINLRKKKDD